MSEQPLARFRAGAMSCALWENEIAVNGTTKMVLKASVSRRYKDKDGNWKSSQSFSRNEIPLAIYCLERAFAKIIEEETAQAGSNGSVEEEVVM
ncbi:hypothetical protein ACFL09_01980 [Planctomycetota bacterium]